MIENKLTPVKLIEFCENDDTTVRFTMDRREYYLSKVSLDRNVSVSPLL